MTGYIDRIWGATGAGSSITMPRIDAAADDPRIVNVPSGLRKLLQRADIHPPAVGQKFAVKELDAQLAAAKFSLEDRMAVKSGLDAYGLIAR